MFTMRYKKFISAVVAMEIISCVVATILSRTPDFSVNDAWGLFTFTFFFFFIALIVIKKGLSTNIPKGGFLPLLYFLPGMFLLAGKSISVEDPQNQEELQAAWSTPMGDELGTLWYHLVGTCFLVLTSIFMILWALLNRIRNMRCEGEIQGASVFWKILLQTNVYCLMLSLITIPLFKSWLGDFFSDNVSSLIGLALVFVAVSSFLFLNYRDQAPETDEERRKREEKERRAEEKRLEKEREEEERRRQIEAEKEVEEVRRTLRKALEEFIVKEYKDRPQEQRNVAYYLVGMNSNLDDDKYLAHVKSKISEKNVREMALRACGLDQSQISEITPVKFEGFSFEDSVLFKPLKDGSWISNRYQVTFIFFTDETLRLYEATFDLTSDDEPVENTKVIALSRIDSLGSSNEPMQVTMHGVTERIRYQRIQLILSSGGGVVIPIDNEKQRDAVLAKWLEIQKHRT